MPTQPFNPTAFARAISNREMRAKTMKRYGLTRAEYDARKAEIKGKAVPVTPDEWVLPDTRAAKVEVKTEARKAPAHGGKWKRWVVCSDNHGDKEDPGATDAFFRFLEHWNPTLRIHAGDCFDFRPLRRGASADEKCESMRADYDAGRNFLQRLYGGNSAGENYFLQGNHDARVWELAEYGKGVERDFGIEKVGAIEQFLSVHNCRMLPYHKRDGILKVGHLKVLHGFHCGIYAARQTALVYGSALFGHTHQIQEMHIPGLERRAARNIGCLTLLDHDYNARTPGSLAQAHGWAFGVISTVTGDYQAYQAEKIGDAWMLPSGIEEI